MNHGILARSPAGTIHWFESNTADERTRLSRAVSSQIRKFNATCNYESFNAFSAKHNTPVYLLKVTVTKQGKGKR